MSYQAVVSAKNNVIRVAALAGSRSVLLGFDFLGSNEERAKFLGFSIHRTDETENESHWLKGDLRFECDQGDEGDEITTKKAPIQKFNWGDYSVYPGRRYLYRVYPAFGEPCALAPGEPVEIKIELAPDDDGIVGAIFNRGVTAAPSYLKRFGDIPPNKVPNGAAYRWLSRGLDEALLGFIRGAGDGDRLDVAIYEFEHEAVIEELKNARKRKVDLRILYHAKSGDAQTAENAKNVKALDLPSGRVVARKNVDKISHNKFIILYPKGRSVPEKVWTGSTNFTEAGLYLQTNVGLILHDPQVAAAYGGYFEILWKDQPKAATAVEIANLLQAFPGPTTFSGKVFFSPVKGTELLDVAAEMITSARHGIFISCPFGLDSRILAALNGNGDRILEFGLVNTTNRNKLKAGLERQVNSWFASPAYIPEYDRRLWDAKAYGQHKIHVKSIVTDPWGNRPRVLIGSANFSDESVNKNDENALLIEGDSRLAAIVTTEFMRMFDHYKFRDFMKRTKKKPENRFLNVDGAWTDNYFSSKSFKLRTREVFAGPWSP